MFSTHPTPQDLPSPGEDHEDLSCPDKIQIVHHVVWFDPYMPGTGQKVPGLVVDGR